MEKGYWETEEFEDLISRSLIAMYEKSIHKKCYKVPSFIKPTDKDIQQIRNLGAYFTPKDRIVYADYKIDLINDGLPTEAAWSFDPTDSYEFSENIMGNYGAQKERIDLIEGEYFRLAYLRFAGNPPAAILNKNGLKYSSKYKIYKILYFSPTQNKGVSLRKSYISIDEEGKIYDTYARKEDGKLQIIAHGTISSEQDPNKMIESDIGWVSAIIGFYQDRRYLWNVTANEGYAKATFGVYPEQIKSLFYARQLPLTETGRKRPILHWVNAHSRRIKEGIDVDIEKHLRGINEFVYKGTKFSITRPIKNTERAGI